MKFQCHSCQTRYSISDERVRGKVLKIRCKNCSEIVEVRDPAKAGAEKKASAEKKAPAIPKEAKQESLPEKEDSIATTPPVEKKAAEASQEWYVSLNGDQHGPFSVEDAKEWLSSKAGGGDFYCWSEGFTDWLPVGDVKEFAGSVKQPDALQRGNMFDNFDHRDDGASGEGDLFEVGEVSRVVKLPQLAGLGSTPAKKTVQLGTADMSALPGALLPPDLTTTSSKKKSSKRGGLVFVVLGALIIAGVAAAIVQLKGMGESREYGSTSDDSSNLGIRYNEDGIRIPGQKKKQIAKRPRQQRPSGGTKASSGATGGGTQTAVNPESFGKDELTPDMVDRKVRKSGMQYKRCYARAQKKDPFLKLKKVTVSLSVSKAGKVTSTKLSSHDNHALGACIKRAVGRWTFPANSSGIKSEFRILFGNG